MTIAVDLGRKATNKQTNKQNRTDVYSKIPKGINAHEDTQHGITQCTNMAVDGAVIVCSRI